MVKCYIKDPKVITQEDDMLLLELDKLICNERKIKD